MLTLKNFVVHPAQQQFLLQSQFHRFFNPFHFYFRGLTHPTNPHTLPPLRPHYLHHNHPHFYRENTTSEPTDTPITHENQDLSISLFPRRPLALPDDRANLARPSHQSRSEQPVTPPQDPIWNIRWESRSTKRMATSSTWLVAFRNFASALVLSNMCGPPHSGAMSSPPALRICGSPCTIMHFKLGNNYCNLSSLIVKLWLMILIVH